MDLVRTLLVPDGRTTRREIRKFGILGVALNDPLDREVSVVQSERGFERLFPIWETVRRKVDPLVQTNFRVVLAELFDDPRSARVLPIYQRRYSTP